MVFALRSANQRRDTGNITFDLVADMESDASAASPTAHNSPAEGYEYYEPKEIVAEKHCSDRGETVYLIEWAEYPFDEWGLVTIAIKIFANPT